MEEPKQQERPLSAPFNFAVATLMSIHAISDNITKVSGLQSIDSGNPNRIPRGEAQHMKYEFIRQLFIRSMPLIMKKDKIDNQKWVNEIKDRIFQAKEKLIVHPMTNPVNKQLVGYKELFNQDFEDELDLITLEIYAKLQEEGYIMPSKSDPRYVWKQSA